MICMAEGGKKKGLPDRTSNAAERQGSLFFNLPCIRCKFSNVVQSKSIAKDIQYHVQRVGGNGLVVFKPLYLRPADTVFSIIIGKLQNMTDEEFEQFELTEAE